MLFLALGAQVSVAWNSGPLRLQQWNSCQSLDVFPFGSGVTFGPGRGTAGGCFVTPCQGVFLISKVSCGWVSVLGTVELPARTLNCLIRFRVTFGPGRGAGLFRHAVPGCFPDSKGVLWLGFCAWKSEIASRTLIFSFGS